MPQQGHEWVSVVQTIYHTSNFHRLITSHEQEQITLSFTYPLVWFITTMFINFTCLSPFWLVLWFKSVFWNFLRRCILKINQCSLSKDTDKGIITVTVMTYPDTFLNEGKQNFWRTSTFLQEKNVTRIEKRNLWLTKKKFQLDTMSVSSYISRQ